jgi:site-specific recombinase XerD
LLINGMHSKILQEMLGHSSVRIGRFLAPGWFIS